MKQRISWPFLGGMVGVSLAIQALGAPAPLTAERVPDVFRPTDGVSRVMVLWSVDCAPCLKELRQIGAWIKDHRGLAFTLISTDESASADEVEGVVRRYGLETLENWQFAEPVPERLRHAIDPQWYGELPRSYLIRADGSRSAHSGLLDDATLQSRFPEPKHIQTSGK